MAIKNKAKIKDDHLKDVRVAMQHRATWFYFLLDEARKRGLEWDDFAREAIFRTGCLHGDRTFSKMGDLREFAGQFATDLTKKLMEMEVVESTQDRLVIEFHYCPLVSAWMRLTDNEKDIAHLCDIAMDGDRAIVSRLPGIHLDIQETIANGGDVCRLVFTAET